MPDSRLKGSSSGIGFRAVTQGTLLAFIDESGQRGTSATSSDHFVMSAAVVRGQDLPVASLFLATLRAELRRNPGDHLTWKNLKTHSDRLHTAQALGAVPWLRVCSVVVCKRHLCRMSLNDDQAYLYTVRFLLERLSWLGRKYNSTVTYTLAAIQRFPKSKLRTYEAILTQEAGCQIDWQYLDPRGGQIDQPQRYEPLQLGDLTASAIAKAFEPDEFGNTEPRYLQELRARLWGGPYRKPKLTSYGLKMHPWNGTTKAAYPWVAAL